MSATFLRGKTVLVTGGTGSFGSHFVSRLLESTPVKKVIVFSRDEWKQFRMKSEFDKEPRLRFFLGDVRDVERLRRAFLGVDIVVHAAALKQVPMLEYNPFEAVKTNVLGTQNVIEAAIDTGVEKVLFISTDKAAEPINLYGSTKLCAEKLTVGGNAYSPKIRCSCVRYGNVIGSRGSIVETLLKNAGAGEVHITHEEMTRFWIDLAGSFELILFALANMAGGEVFVPKIPSMKLVDLFVALAPEAKRRVIGVRPGEKLHESLLTVNEARHALDLGRYFVILPEGSDAFDIKKRFAKFLRRGKKMPKDFSYTSRTNTKWLTTEDLRQLAKAHH